MSGLMGKPVILWTVGQALHWRDSHPRHNVDIVVSSDDTGILDCVGVYCGMEGKGVILSRRADSLAYDCTPKAPVIRDCLLERESNGDGVYDVVIDLDATAPLRKPGDIDDCLREWSKETSKGTIDTVYTGVVSRRNPYFNMVQTDVGGCPEGVMCSGDKGKRIDRRQDAPYTYDVVGAVGLFRAGYLRQGGNTLLARDSRIVVLEEWQGFDIDTEFDLWLVEQVMGKMAAKMAGVKEAAAQTSGKVKRSKKG